MTPAADRSASWVLTITGHAGTSPVGPLGGHGARAMAGPDPDEFPPPSASRSREGRRRRDAALRSDAVGGHAGALIELPVEQRRAVVLAAFYGRTAKEIRGCRSRFPSGQAKTRIPRRFASGSRAAMVSEDAAS